MKQAQHTQGPWRIDTEPSEDNLDIFVFTGSDEDNTRCDIAAVKIRGVNRPYNRDVQLANAKLIAAAPETTAERDRLKSAFDELLQSMIALQRENGDLRETINWAKKGLEAAEEALHRANSLVHGVNFNNALNQIKSAQTAMNKHAAIAAARGK